MFVSLSLQHSRLSRGKLALPCEGMICLLPLLYNYINAHPFNSPLSATTQVSRYQKGKTNLDFTEAGDSEWQWHQLGHMQVCTLLQTDNHSSTPLLFFYRPDALPTAQPTASKHWRHNYIHGNKNCYLFLSVNNDTKLLLGVETFQVFGHCIMDCLLALYFLTILSSYLV